MGLLYRGRVVLQATEKELPREVRESSTCPLIAGVLLNVGVPFARRAAGERRGEGEPELDRRPAPSHPCRLSHARNASFY